MKKYKYNFPKSALIFMLLGIVVAIACCVWNIYRFLIIIKENIDPSIYDYLSLAIAILLSIAFIVIAICAYFNSYYVIKQNKVILNWGIIKTTVDLNEVKEIKLITDKNQLQLVFKDESYFIIATNTLDFSTFIEEIKSNKKEIVYIQDTESEDKSGKNV